MTLVQESTRFVCRLALILSDAGTVKLDSRMGTSIGHIPGNKKGTINLHLIIIFLLPPWMHPKTNSFWFKW